MTEHSDQDNQVSFAFHPYNVLLSLVLFGISALFLAFSAAFIYTRVQGGIPPIKLPYIFLLNTIVLLGSSYTMVLAKRAYINDDTKKYEQSLIYTIILSLIFLVLQGIGWYQLFIDNISITHSNTASYLYVISIMHFLHVVAGLPFLVAFVYVARKRMKEPVSVLVYFSDPEKRLKLKLLTMYWHFLDALWIYLVLFFYLNYFIQ